MKFKIITSLLTLISFIGFSQEKKQFPMNNIISANLASIAAYGNLGGPGIGLSYEHILKNNEKLGIQIPVSFYFENLNSSNTFTIAPTLKVYPFGSQRPIAWSVGAGIRYAGGTEEFYYGYDYVLGQDGKSEERKVNYIGSEVQNALNVNVGNLYLNLNSSLGLIYNDGGKGIATLNLLVGVRF